MKKALSLVLALVMVLSCVSGFAFAADASDPTVEHGNIMAITATGDVHYLPVLNTAAVTWAANQEGGATLYLLRDAEITEQISFPTTWVASNPVTLDLNGNTLTSNGNQYDIIIKGNGVFTVQNGIYEHKGTRGNILIGVSSDHNLEDPVYMASDATVNIKNAFVYNSNTAGPVLYSYYKKTNLNVEDSILWTNHGGTYGTCYLEYAAEFHVNITDSIIGNKGSHIFGVRNMDDKNWICGNNTLNATNALLANSTGKAYLDSAWVQINGTWVNGATATAVPTQSATVYDGKWSIDAPNGIKLETAGAQYFGEVPTGIEINVSVFLMDDEGNISSRNDMVQGDEYILPTTSAGGADWNTKPDGTGVAYKAGDVVTTGMALYPAEAKFVFTLDADYHLCTIQCAVCGGCLDAACDKAVCADKCVLATLKLDDVKAGHWYKDAVEYVYHAGIMEGTSKTAFGADKVVTRATVITALWNMAGKPTTYNSIRFSDVAAGQSYTEAVRWAAGYGITTGNGDGNFDPNGEVTREQLATFLYRFAKYMNLNTTVNADIAGYADAASVSSYAADALKWANGAGVINGKSGKVLDPTGDATRAELAKMLMVVSNL